MNTTTESKLVTMEEMENCFFSKERNSIIDLINPYTERGAYGNKTLEECKEEYPDAVIMLWDDAYKMKLEGSRRPVPVEIDQARYDEMLNVLPPRGWVQAGHSSFKMSEMYDGDLTSIFCQVDGKYYTFLDSVFMTHDEIVKRVKDHMKGGDQ